MKDEFNQYAVAFDPAEPAVTWYEPEYHIDGGLATDWVWNYSYDAEDRLASVDPTFPEDGSLRVLNEYDYRNRRIRKIDQRLTVTVPPPPSPPIETHTWDTIETRSFVYDGWNLIHETVLSVDGATTNTIETQYFWGLDLSDTLHGAGGVGGLLAVSCEGQFYFPTYDNNGNVTKYIDESGNIFAAYEYDDFGKLISYSGPLADLFHIRFSTKYCDPETGLYFYGERFYSPDWRIWLNRDPIAESGGFNLYSFCRNRSVDKYDYIGRHWEFSTPRWNDLLEEISFSVKYIMSRSERKCCTSVTVDRYVRKLFGVGNRFGPYTLDHAGEGGMTDYKKPYIAYAENDSPDGQNFYLYRLPWTQSFKWQARCTGGRNAGKILSTIERKFRTSGHWLWSPKREGMFL